MTYAVDCIYASDSDTERSRAEWTSLQPNSLAKLNCYWVHVRPSDDGIEFVCYSRVGKNLGFLAEPWYYASAWSGRPLVCARDVPPCSRQIALAIYPHLSESEKVDWTLRQQSTVDEIEAAVSVVSDFVSCVCDVLGFESVVADHLWAACRVAERKRLTALWHTDPDDHVCPPWRERARLPEWVEYLRRDGRLDALVVKREEKRS